jgi:ferrous iron transporter FeoB
MKPITIALAGNPNCGKTTLFNDLTGASQYVGNWPGVTVERKGGQLNQFPDIEIQDLPGIYSLSPYTLEEVVSRDYLVKDEPSLIVDLVDATNLERNLYLTTQLQELGRPVIIALNMVDLLKTRGITIDVKKLSKALHCPVVEISALKGTGVKELVQQAVATAKDSSAKAPETIRFSDEVETALGKIADLVTCDDNLKRWYSIKLFERDEKIQSQLALSAEVSEKIESIVAEAESALDDDSESIITGGRYEAIGDIVSTCMTKQKHGMTISDKIDRIVTNRIFALPIFFVVMWAVYYLSINTIGDWGTGWANDTLFGEIVGPWVDGFIGETPAGLGLIAFVAVVLSMILVFPAMLRRLHDIGMKGAWMYLAIIPFIFAFIIMPNVEEEEEEPAKTEEVVAVAETADTQKAEITVVATEATVKADEATDTKAEEKADEPAEAEDSVSGELTAVIDTYSSVIDSVTGFFGAILRTIYTPVMWILGVANAVLLILCLFKPGQKGTNDFGPEAETSPVSSKNIKSLLSLKGRSGRLTFITHYIILSAVAIGIALLGTLALNCNHILVDFVQNAIVNGVGAVLGFLPQMAVLFLCMALLEDCGYMARVAFVMDRIFRKFGLSGKSFIPMLVSMGCGVPGIMATRTIENEKDRRMTIMLTTNMPCGAKVPIIAVLAFAFFPEDTGLITTSVYFIGLASIILAGIILKKSSLFAGDPAPFVMELPAYHMPAVSNVSMRAIERCKSFVQKAGTVIFFACAIVWFLKSHDWTMTYLDDHEEAVAEANAEGAPTPEAKPEAVAETKDEEPAIDRSMLADIGGVVSPVFAPLGWAEKTESARDWKPTVAAITGLVAKEDVVATLSMLYASGDEDEEDGSTEEPEFDLFTEGNALSALTTAVLNIWEPVAVQEPAKDDGNGEEEDEDEETRATAGLLRDAKALGGDPLVAFSFLLFNLLCAPCFAAMGAIRREMNSGKWTAIAIAWLCCWAYYLAFLVYQLGSWFRNGVFGAGQIIALIGLLAGLYMLFRKPASPKSK